MKPQQFWTWFQDNEHKLYILPLLSTDEQEEYTYWLRTHLNYYWEGIEFKIKFCKTYNTPATLTFFPEGDSVIIKKILELVQAAPSMENWSIQIDNLKKEANITNKIIGPPNFKLNINQLYFQPIFKNNKDNKITINIFTTKKVSYAKRKQFKMLCVKYLKDMIGEESLNSHIQSIRCNLQSPVPGVAIKVIHFSQFIKNIT